MGNRWEFPGGPVVRTRASTAGLQGTRVRSLARELRSRMPRAVAKKKKKKRKEKKQATGTSAWGCPASSQTAGSKTTGLLSLVWEQVPDGGSRRGPGENLPRSGSSGPGPWAGATLLFPRLPSACPPSSYGTPALDWARATRYSLVLTTHVCGDPTSNKGLFWVWVDVKLGRRPSTRAQP